jgi:membrane-bound lytic murein transglycosylase D
VHSYVEYYRDKQREFFERSYLRKHKYWPTIRPVFEAKRIPLELGYMALVESGFAPLARSRANARGLWQFIPGTGRRYGLERAEDFYDVQRSTDAAAEYLLDLIGIYGSDSFLLATASYNAGEGRIMGCLRHLDDPFGGRSFWEIRGCLARETREYVPRILAAAIIASIWRAKTSCASFST